ncbi:MAG: hypothetical protein J6J07_03250, partial [Oscillospiraceae bacterium]|nr:hypothetical protein [Oscillospiraceae bacterium]
MKKVFSVFVLILMIFTFSITSSALQEEALVFNGEITIHVPEGYYSLEKDIPEDSEKLKELGITKEDFLPILGDAEILLTTEDLNTQIYIYCEKTDYIPYEFFTENEKTEYISELREGYEESGYNVLDAEMVPNRETIFTKTSIAGSEDYVPMIIYETVFKELYLTVILYNFNDGEISEIQETASDSLVYGIEFNTNNYALKNTVPVEYTVNGIGTKFTLPEGWYLDLNSDGSLMAIKSKDVAMVYYTYNAWDTFTEEEKSQVHRSKLDMDLFTKEDLIEIIESEEMKKEYNSFGMDIVEDSVYMMEIGNYNCAIWKIEATEDVHGFKEATAIMYVEDAMGHIFMFTGPFSGKMAEEYKGIVASAKFPEIPEEG